MSGTGAAPRWRIRALGSRWQFSFFHALIRAFGLAPAYAMADLVSLAYVAARPEVRRRCRPYLMRRFPARRGAGRFLDAWRMTRAFARTLVDQAALAIRPGAFRSLAIGRQQVQELLAEDRGLVILTAHVGAWQQGMANMAALGRPITVLIHQGGDGPDPTLGEACRAVDPAAFLGGVPDLVAALERREVVCVMGDRAWGRTEVAVPFLGDPVPLPLLPYRLASATGAPIAVLFPHKPAPDQYEMALEAVIRVPPGLGRRGAPYAPYAARFSRALETFLDRHPYQFFNFFDLWEQG